MVEKSNFELLDNLYNDIEIIPKDNKYKDLCHSIVHTVRAFHKTNIKKEELMRSGIRVSKDKLNTLFDSPLKILLLGLNLIFSGREDSISDLIINLEFNKTICKNPNITDEEILELILTREFIYYIRKGNTDDIYSLISYICDNKLSRELLPNINWFNMPT